MTIKKSNYNNIINDYKSIDSEINNLTKMIQQLIIKHKNKTFTNDNINKINMMVEEKLQNGYKYPIYPNIKMEILYIRIFDYI